MDHSSNIIPLFAERSKLQFPTHQTLEERLPTYENVIGMVPRLKGNTYKTSADILQFPLTSHTTTEKTINQQKLELSLGTGLWTIASALQLRAGFIAHYNYSEHLALPLSVLSDERFYFGLSLGAACMSIAYAYDFLQTKRKGNA